MLVYDVTNRQSFIVLNDIMKLNETEPTKIYIVENKKYLEKERQFSTEEGQTFAANNKSDHFCEVSARDQERLSNLLSFND